MAYFGKMLWPVARKEHRCEACWGPIPKGERHAQANGMWGGEFQHWRMHEECYADFHAENPFGGEFAPGDAPVPERIKLLMEAEK